ncbi:MAG TPA: ABC transporter substrate-binding protein [Actinomycetaceae bacterium]|nr:ABC transporter substrate-binding protein [Actinomycetaceae bacterium]
MTARNPRRLVLAAGLVGTFALAACSTSSAEEGGGSADEPVEITWYSYNYGSASVAGEGTEVLLEAFAEAHPEIKLIPQAVPTADILTKTRADVAAGNPPDVVQMGYSKLDEAKKTLPLQPLDEIAGDAWETHTAGINPGLIETGMWEGAPRSMPYSVSVPALFYNADIFTEAGLDPDNPPATAQEVRDAAQQIVDAGYEGVYYGAIDSGGSDYLTQSVLNSAGTGIVDDAGNITIDSPEAVEALTYLQDLTLDGLQPAVQVEDGVGAFNNGDLGMFLATTAYSMSLSAAAEGNFELRSGGFPTFTDGPARPTHSGAGLVVLADDPAKQEAAWTFLEFMTSAEGYTIITEEMGYLPLREDIVEDPDYLADYFAEHTLLIPSLSDLRTVEPYRVFPVENSNRATVTFQDNAVEPIMLRGAEVESTLADVAQQIRDLG